MDFLIGITGKDFVLLAADASYARSVVRMKDDQDKMLQLSDHVISALSGPVGDCVNFGEYIAKNLKLMEMKNGYSASTWATANYVRRNLAESLRSRGAYQVNLLVAGFDAKDGPQLYYLDHLAAMAKVPYAAHGYGGFFTLATMDRHFKEDMTLEEASDVLRKCFAEVRTRFVMGMPNFKVRVADKDGVRVLEDF